MPTDGPEASAQQPTQLSLDDFEVLAEEPLLVGCHGDGVRKIRRKSDGRVLVWKRVSFGSMDDAELRALLSELLVIRQIRHANIVEYVGRIIDQENQLVYIVTELCPNGDLARVIRRHRRDGKYIEEEKIWKWLTQLALALRCCHCRQGVKAVLHRDLKPANCFLDAGDNLKLGDFGLARVLRNSASFASTFVGTPYYMSPEQMQKSAYTEKSDIWSLGIVAYEMACLRPPFVADKQRELAARIKRGEFEPLPERYGQGLRSLVADCLAVREDLRPSVEELLGRPEMRARIPCDEAPEASLGRWAEDLRAFSDLLSAWQDSLNRREELMKRREAAMAADVAAKQMELERRRAQLDRLRDQLGERAAQMRELQAWLRQSGLLAAAASSMRSGGDNFFSEDNGYDLGVEAAAEAAGAAAVAEKAESSSGFEDTLPVPPVSFGSAIDSPASGNPVRLGSAIECSAGGTPQPPERLGWAIDSSAKSMPQPPLPVPQPRRSLLRNAGDVN